jgi:hypothetical protein
MKTRAPKSASAKAGEFVREEIREIRAGKHGARSAKQAIAIGLSKARRAGVPLSPPKPGRASARVRHKAEQDLQRGRHPGRKVSARRSRATTSALKRERHDTVSHAALSRQTPAAARKRAPSQRSASARKAARTRAAHRR